MGMTAALKLRRIVDNTRSVLAIEAMAAAQAVEFLAPLKTSKRLQGAQSAIRSVSPPMEKDRVIYGDFVKIAEVIAGGKLSEALR
jgi:histidine ammonia-lyase